MEEVQHEEDERAWEDREGEVQRYQGSEALVYSPGSDDLEDILHIVELGLAVYLLVSLSEHGDQDGHEEDEVSQDAEYQKHLS